MTDYIINDMWDYMYGNYGEEIIDGFLVVPSSSGNTLLTVCREEEYEKFRERGLDLASRNPDVSNVDIFYVGDVNFSEERNIQRVQLFGANLCWIWFNDARLLNAEEALGSYIRSYCARILSSDLSNLQRGDGSTFENLLATIIKFALPFAVANFQQKVRAFDGAKIRDAKIAMIVGSELQSHIHRMGLPSNNLLLEAKNQAHDTRDDIEQVRGYLGPTKFASVGLFVTRSALSATLQRAVMEENRKGDHANRALIIALDDRHTQQLIRNAGFGDFIANERMLIDEAEHALNAVY